MVEKESLSYSLQQSLELNPWEHDADRPVSSTSEGLAPSMMGKRPPSYSPKRTPSSQELLVWQRKHHIKSNRYISLQLK